MALALGNVILGHEVHRPELGLEILSDPNYITDPITKSYLDFSVQTLDHWAPCAIQRYVFSIGFLHISAKSSQPMKYYMC